MSRLLSYFLIAFFTFTSFSTAQSCKLEAIGLQVRIETDPGTVLYALGDAIALYPHCMAEFIETAITTAQPDDATLTEIIKLAVSEYPLEAGTIAEAAVLAAPEKVDVIRTAFLPPEKPIIATPVLDEPEMNSPIESFLSNYQPETTSPIAHTEAQPMEQIAVPENPQPEDVALAALKAIDELIAKLKINSGQDGCNDHSCDSNVPSLHNNVESFTLNIPDNSIVLTTINDSDYLDRTDENIAEPSAAPLTFEDPVNPEVSLVEYLEKEIKTKVESAQVKTKNQPAVNFTSSVYPIPSPDAPRKESRPITQPQIKSATVSPTLPRIR
ncbi:MAG: hypothetical protein P1V20_24730 [Verrucomicrobiales bacterium]|nr:hypothetical protein [Verrucomicrobiales bacterium]